ncbi:MAG: thiosulfate oxidation carrier complex protein SoxZ [Polynucleobacter sp.]|jgi:sulfur-oxidizing protein SoxZ|nr:thiosulfate oxidation carrier complex protein SoxZ [Polynucleobacter sp.]
MSRTSRTIVTIPSTARQGEVIEIRAIAQHDMESGFRHTERGQLVPRDIIRRMVCLYNGIEIFSTDLQPAVGANPLFIFTTIAQESGMIECRWTGDNDYSATSSALLTVA